MPVMYTTIHSFGVRMIISFKEINFFFSKDALKLSKGTVKTFVMLKEISINKFIINK